MINYNRHYDYTRWPRIKKEIFLKKLRADSEYNKYDKYADNPLGFCNEVLGDTFYSDVEKLINSVRDNKITVAISATGTGKTHAAARIAVWYFKTYKGSVYTAAAPPINNLQKLLWGELSDVYNNNPDLFKDENLTYLNISRPNENKEIITGMVIPQTGGEYQIESKFSGKHYHHQIFIIDEGDAVPEACYRGIYGCLSGGHGRLLIMFNPREKSGPVFELIESGKANVIHLSAFNHPNVITGKEIYPGAVTREKTVERINEQCRLLEPDETIDHNCFELPKYLINETAEIKNGEYYPPLKAGYYKILVKMFFYQVLGQYPTAGEDSLIDEEWINQARLRYDMYVSEYGDIPPKGIRAIMGQDVAELGSDSNVACFRYGGYVKPLIKWDGVDTTITAEKAVIEYRKHKASKAFVDSTGVGSNVAPTMKKKGCNSYRCMVGSKPTKESPLGEFKLLNDQLAWSVREWLRTDKTAMLPPDPRLLKQLRILTYTMKKGPIQVMNKEEQKKILKYSPDEFDALKLTFAPGEPEAHIRFM